VARPPRLHIGRPARHALGRSTDISPPDTCPLPPLKTSNAGRPGFPRCRHCTGAEQSAVGRPSYAVISRFRSRHFCSGLTDLTFSIYYVKCPCSVFVTVTNTCVIIIIIMIIIIIIQRTQLPPDSFKTHMNSIIFN